MGYACSCLNAPTRPFQGRNKGVISDVAEPLAQTMFTNNRSNVNSPNIDCKLYYEYP